MFFVFPILMCVKTYLKSDISHRCKHIWKWWKLVVTPRLSKKKSLTLFTTLQQYVFIRHGEICLEMRLFLSPCIQPVFLVNLRYPRGSFLCSRQIFECQGAQNAMSTNTIHRSFTSFPHCWWFRNPAITSWYGASPIIYRVSCISGGARRNFFHQQ